MLKLQACVAAFGGMGVGAGVAGATQRRQQRQQKQQGLEGKKRWVLDLVAPPAWTPRQRLSASSLCFEHACKRCAPH